MATNTWSERTSIWLQYYIFSWCSDCRSKKAQKNTFIRTFFQSQADLLTFATFVAFIAFVAFASLPFTLPSFLSFARLVPWEAGSVQERPEVHWVPTNCSALFRKKHQMLTSLLWSTASQPSVQKGVSLFRGQCFLTGRIGRIKCHHGLFQLLIGWCNWFLIHSRAPRLCLTRLSAFQPAAVMASHKNQVRRLLAKSFSYMNM